MLSAHNGIGTEKRAPVRRSGGMNTPSHRRRDADVTGLIRAASLLQVPRLTNQELGAFFVAGASQRESKQIRRPIFGRLCP